MKLAEIGRAIWRKRLYNTGRPLSAPAYARRVVTILGKAHPLATLVDREAVTSLLSCPSMSIEKFRKTCGDHSEVALCGDRRRNR